MDVFYKPPVIPNSPDEASNRVNVTPSKNRDVMPSVHGVHQATRQNISRGGGTGENGGGGGGGGVIAGGSGGAGSSDRSSGGAARSDRPGGGTARTEKSKSSEKSGGGARNSSKWGRTAERSETFGGLTGRSDKSDGVSSSQSSGPPSDNDDDTALEDLQRNIETLERSLKKNTKDTIIDIEPEPSRSRKLKGAGKRFLRQVVYPKFIILF